MNFKERLSNVLLIIMFDFPENSVNMGNIITEKCGHLHYISNIKRNIVP